MSEDHKLKYICPIMPFSDTVFFFFFFFFFFFCLFVFCEVILNMQKKNTLYIFITFSAEIY